MSPDFTPTNSDVIEPQRGQFVSIQGISAINNEAGQGHSRGNNSPIAVNDFFPLRHKDQGLGCSRLPR